MIGKNHFVLYPHEENESIFRHVRDTGEPFSIRDKPFEYPDQPGRGTTYWDWTLTPVKDREGWVSGLIFSLFETTERKRAEQALRESEARLKLAQSAARSGVWDYDVIKDELRWSDEYYELYGISKEVPPSREDWLLSIHPEDREMAAKSQGEAIVRREFTNFDFRITRPDGQVRWLATQGQVLLDPDNQPVRIIGTSMDITARKRAEEELARSEGRIRRRLESLLAPEGDIGTLELGDLLDIPALQALMEDFTRASGTATAILDTQGTVLVATGWQDICTRFHRVHQVTAAFCTESDLALAKDLKEGEYLAYKCRNNLRDVVTPLYIGGRHMGNIFTGQFFYDDDIVDESVFVAQAKAYGFDRDAYLDALHRVSRVSRDRVRARMEYLVRMTGFFSKLSYSNLSLARTVHQRDELVRSLQVSEEALREEKVLLAKSQAIAHVGSWEYDLTTNHLTWSDEVYRIFGCRPQEFAATYEAFLAFVHPDDRTAVNEAYSGLLREGADSYEIEHRIVQSGTGDIRWVHERCVHERDDAGKIIRSVGMVHAITARKRAEEALQRAHAELEARVVERTRELNRRIAQVETLNAATTNLLQDLRAANQVQQQTNQELARLHEQLREQRVAEQAALLKLSQALLGETDSQKIMDLAVREAAAALKVEIASLSLLEEDGEHISIRASLGWATELAQRVNHVPLAESGTTSQAIRNRTPFIRRGTVGEMPPPLPDIVSQVGIVATAVAPLLLGNNSVGTLAVGSRTPRDWADDDVRLLSLIASTTAQALERARLFEQVSAGRARFEVLSQRLVEIQESERRYIARELHDEIGQMLTGLKLLLTTEVGATTKRMRANADEARTLVGDLMMRVRELSLNLRPAMLDDLGLLPALLWFIGRYEKQTRVRVSFVHLGIEGARFSREIETTAYRIAQEALTNVARHAHVSEVSVRVWAHDRVLEIYVEDHGRGFDPAAELVAGKSSGLPGMRERAILIGGQLTLDSAPGTGTRVIAELPLGDRVERRSSDRLNPTSG
jgi:PAS domain S-box-containing protein